MVFYPDHSTQMEDVVEYRTGGHVIGLLQFSLMEKVESFYRIQITNTRTSFAKPLDMQFPSCILNAAFLINPDDITLHKAALCVRVSSCMRS